ncbi:hypothetical protein [Tenacibaculum sp. L6]|uniref:hypothetical protein n=1 Tax=Tenacibaculum sp. L6 TaxID=2992764 RepID=UPI00237A4212|nr:hypothetical protein [Tenacibaculum sp. L6]MDE0535300.1 hypothetical protein [Tenacibaculum sp. L6]
MRLLIVPIGKNHKPIEEEIIELETNSEESISKALLSVMKGKRYSIEIYKNLKDFLVLHIDIETGVSFYVENKQEHKYVFEKHPYEDAIDLIKIYIAPNGSEKLKQIFVNHKEKLKRLEKERYDKWKIEYHINQKKERKNNIIKYSILFIILGVFSSIVYLIFIDELRFIGRKTITKKGVITKTDFHHIGSGYYMQTVKYKFVYNDIFYSDDFEAGKLLGKQYVGDSVLIKFRETNPTVSKYIKTIYE